MKIIEYRVERHWNLDTFNAIVTKLINEDWILLGNLVSGVDGDDDIFYCQVLVKLEN